MKTLETKPCAAVYSVFQDTERREADGLPPIVPFDTIAFEGECIVYVEKDSFWGGNDSRDYFSPVLFCPTWGELFKIADESMKTTGDFHHCFFEGYRKSDNLAVKHIPIIYFLMGS